MIGMVTFEGGGHVARRSEQGVDEAEECQES